ncbi:MAG: SRPBCC family protein [Chloroflexota bacterium]
MAQITVEVERDIAAPAERAYRCIAEFTKRATWAPPEFSDFQVLEGGIGAGTLFTFHFSSRGRERDFRMLVDEPEPGRTLTETDQNSTLVTTYSVIPTGNGSLVSIRTVWQGAGGIGGFFERTFAPRALSRIFADELERLSALLRDEGLGVSTGTPE